MAEKVKRTRAKKLLSANEIMAIIKSHPLETKVSLICLLNDDIEEEKKQLEGKLKLIADVKF